MTNEVAREVLEKLQIAIGFDAPSVCTQKELVEALDLAIESLEAWDKLDIIIVEQLDNSNDHKECMTLRWVLDKMSEVNDEQIRDEKMIDAIDFAIEATDSKDDYSMGMRNGMRYVKSLIDGKEPQYELRRTDEEIELGIDLGDEVIDDYGTKGVVVGIDTYKGKVLLSLLMRNHKVPQLVNALKYKTKTDRHFPQIIEVLEQIKGEADEK